VLTGCVACLLGIVVETGLAAAHARIERAFPPIGGTVRSPPAEVSLWFSERLESAFSRVEVFDGAGQRVDKDDSHVARDDPRRLTAALVALKPGAYKVVWRVVSVDTHRTSGEYTFSVAP
jgi:hypothetical protein